MKYEAVVKAVVICALCLSALTPGCTPIPIPLAGEGSIVAMTPTEGTVGTEVTITGTNLGATTGEVLVGDARALVLQWSDTQIVARVSGTLTPGDYVVTVKPWWEAPLTYSSFSIREPELGKSVFHPQFVTGGDTVTVAGRFLGNRAGTIRLENRAGRSVAVDDVSDWSMESVTFQVPTGLTGLWDLIVTNDVAEGAEHSWCTFQACPAGGLREATTVSLVGVAHDTHDIPAAIQFNGALWTFGPSGDDDIWVDAYVNCESWSNMPDPPGKSNITPAPIVIDGMLWLFNTARDGTLEYFKYNSGSQTWSSAVKVPNTSTDSNCAISVAYNNVDPYDRIEVYYYNGGKIYRTYTDNRGGAWSTPTAVISGANWSPSALFWESAVYWDSTNSVTVSVPNATLVVYPYSNGIKVAYLQDGTVVHTAVRSVSSTLEYFQPMLVDLGEDYIAVICSDGNCQPAVRKMSKSTGKWQSTWHPVDYDSNSPCWGTNGALGVHKVADTSSVGGYRYDTNLYLFWGTNGGHLWDDDEWTMKAVEYEGYYIEPEPPVPSNFSSDQADTFYLWPLIGVIDAPPFVANGVDIEAQTCSATTCTNASFGAEASTSVHLGGSASAGVFIESGEHCKAKVEISGEVNASINVEKTLTSERTDTLYRDMGGVVLALYLTPEFRTHTYEWFDNGDTATGKYFYVVELVTLDVTRKTFYPTELPVADPLYVSEPYWDSFPSHATEDDSERLDTYATEPSQAAWFSSSGDWGRASDGEIKWSATTFQETEEGLDIKFSIGKEGKFIGGGVEGSFELETSLTTEITANAKVSLINTDASLASRGDIEDFHVIGYWLAPDDSAYWVPRNRLGMGDKPWFITYWVTSYTEY